MKAIQQQSNDRLQRNKMMNRKKQQKIKEQRLQQMQYQIPHSFNSMRNNSQNDNYCQTQENILPINQSINQQTSHQQQSINKESMIIIQNEEIYDQQEMRRQIKQRYKQHLKQLNLNHVNQYNFNNCMEIIRQIIIAIYAFLQQLWIQIIPQCIRGRYFGQKSSIIMDSYPLLNCGHISLFLQRMKKQSKYFFIIIQSKLKGQSEQQECFDIEQNLFDNSPQSNTKLNYIIQCETISLNNKDLKQLQKNPYIKLDSFIYQNNNKHNRNNKTDNNQEIYKYPLLLVCRYNYLQELKIMGLIQLSQLSQQNFIQLLDQIKQHIFEIKNLQSQCKRQVLTQLLHHNSRSNHQLSYPNHQIQSHHNEINHNQQHNAQYYENSIPQNDIQNNQILNNMTDFQNPSVNQNINHFLN